jgi:teichuronic acid biosynthesis glycosyltransferase TuaG
MSELVSIITPSYNSMKYIRSTIESVKAQSYQNWEMIIIDDCSKDDSVAFIQRLTEGEPRIKLIPLTENVGAAMARNRALDIAVGRFVAFLDSDDMWEPSKLDVQINCMIKHDCAFTYSSYRVCDDSGENVHGEISVPNTLTYQQYLANTIIGCLTVVLDTTKFESIRMPNLRSSHDMALWADLLKTIDKAYGINIPLATYRLVDTSNTANKWKASKEVWAVYRNYLGLNIIVSSYYFVQYAFNAMKKRFYK